MEEYSEQQIEFVKRYIRPFYMDLMKMNFVHKPQEYTNELFSELRSRASELKNEELIKMINEPWRTSKVGAWMVGVGNKKDLKIELIRYLNKPGNHYCEHVLFNYYLMEGENSSAELKKFVNREIEFVLRSEKPLFQIERLSIHWAIALLKHIDKVFYTDHLNEVLGSVLWSDLLKAVNELKISKYILKMFESNYYFETIEESLKRVNTNENNL